MVTNEFYKGGLCFECKRCSACCRHSGYVFLSQKDIAALCEKLGISESGFLKDYCRSVADSGMIRISLIEQANFDCVFYDSKINGCAVYEARPLQCKLYPFWERMVSDGKEWEDAKTACPGIGCGRLYSLGEIEDALSQRRLEPFADLMKCY